MEKNKTAVEWLAEKYNYLAWMRSRDEISASLAVEWLENFLEEAKKMEKQQIIDACDYGIKLYINDPITSEDYYNETYGGNKMDDAKSMMSESQPSCLGAVSGSVFSNDFFDTPLVNQPKISKDDFIKKALPILNKIWQEYGSSFEKPIISEEELEAAPCEKCQGCMQWKYFDEEIQCVQDRIEGECRKIVLNTDLFGGVVEQIIQSDDYQILISSDVV
jgi:hypothetical protein